MYYNKKMVRVFSLISAVCFLVHIVASVCIGGGDYFTYWTNIVYSVSVIALTIFLFIGMQNNVILIVMGVIALLNIYLQIDDWIESFDMSMFSVSILCQRIGFVMIFISFILYSKRMLKGIMYIIPFGLFVVYFIIQWIIEGRIKSLIDNWEFLLRDVFLLLAVLFLCLWVKKLDSIAIQSDAMGGAE